MTDNDRERFAFILQGLAEDKGIQLSTPGIAMKFEALKAFSIEDINRAALYMMGNKKFSSMPSVADFAEYLGGGSADDKGQVQAGIVWDAMRKLGGNRTVCFDDPVTQAVIVQSFGGWQKMCAETMVDQQKWFIKDFIKAYGAFSRQGVKVYGALPGRSDPFNADGPALIGNVDRAQLVLTYDDKTNGIQNDIVKQITLKSAVRSLQ